MGRETLIPWNPPGDPTAKRGPDAGFYQSAATARRDSASSERCMKLQDSLQGLVFDGDGEGWCGQTLERSTSILGSTPRSECRRRDHQHRRTHQYFSTAPHGSPLGVQRRRWIRYGHGSPIRSGPAEAFLPGGCSCGGVYGSSENTDAPVPNPRRSTSCVHGDAYGGDGDESPSITTFPLERPCRRGDLLLESGKTFRECRGVSIDPSPNRCWSRRTPIFVTFRSGWHYMDNGGRTTSTRWVLQHGQRLASSNLHRAFSTAVWSKARPTNFIRFTRRDDKLPGPGDGTGWNVRSVKTPNVPGPGGRHLAEPRRASRVVSFWAHPGILLPDDMERMDAIIHTQCAGASRGLPVRYCTSVEEAMQRWRGLAGDAAGR